MIPLMSVTRNFFMGNEPTRKVLGLSLFDHEQANQVTMDEMRKMGINLACSWSNKGRPNTT